MLLRPNPIAREAPGGFRRRSPTWPCPTRQPVNRLAPGKLFRMLPPDFGDQQQRRSHRAVGFAICDDKVDRWNGLARKLGRPAFNSHRDGLETNTAQAACIHGVDDRGRIEPRRANLLEGTIGPAALGQVRPLEIDGARIAVQGGRRPEIRRWISPGKPGVGEPLSTPPVRRANNDQLDADAELLVEKRRQLADGHAVPGGDRVHAHNDLKAGSSSAPSTMSPPIGLGRSSTTNGMPFRAAACIDSAIVET